MSVPNAAPAAPPRTFPWKRAGLCCVVFLLALGVGWMTAPVWGVFTDRVPETGSWIVPFLQSAWPVGLALLVAALAALVWLTLSRRAAVGATVAAVVVCTATVLVPGALSRVAQKMPEEKDADTVRILSVNTWYHQASDEFLAQTAREMDADIVVLPESSDVQASAVADATDLELLQPVSTRTRGGGTALLVRETWMTEAAAESVADLHLTRHQNPVVELENLTMMGVHTNAPAHSHLVDGWVTEMADLRDWASGVDGPLVMAGDFNSTTAHPELRRLAGRSAEMTDCGGGLFAAPTWPRAGTPSPVPVLRLDHILVRGLTCQDSGVVGVLGSDHAGIWADLRV
ncbi:endonuclease/exonuclease/phosphatase family protein [Corynebacterium variabile]|uniref:endonuclease/exonuclease/phosphatase family protein n=1 Tax=Corynebacterium variabile TaxID=1727 RepID=UPI00289C355B|nr:endonuclease/exonuclease/phosphatase family protein [Corynebacterium variabile]